MAKYNLLLPRMGESVAEATITNWLKKPGDRIDADDAVVEIATDKVDSEVPSPVSGKLLEQLYTVDDTVQVGATIAVIETDDIEEESQAEPEEQQTALAVEEITVTEEEPETKNISGLDQLPPVTVPPAAATVNSFSGIRFYSPLVRNIATQEGLSATELDQIPGSGADGRLTKDDLLNYLQNKKASVSEFSQSLNASNGVVQANVSPQAGASQAKAYQPVSPVVSVSGNDEIIEMDRMRKLISEHMVMSKQTSPHVTSFIEVDVTNLVYWREKVKAKFEKREGEKITFTPLFVEAVAKAITDMPMINVSVSGTQIVKKRNINIGMATALPSGNLIVPVIRNADMLNMVGLVKAVNDLAVRARNNRLQPDETRDGTFTITNIGMFGNAMGTPIINQPQVAILAIGAIKKKPAVLETPTGDVIAIRHMMFLSLSFDHRVVDGALGGAFIKRVADYLENWDIDREV